MRHGPVGMGIRRNLLSRFLLLYAALYASFGLSSPFLQAFLSARDVGPEWLGFLLGAGTAVRLASAGSQAGSQMYSVRFYWSGVSLSRCLDGKISAAAELRKSTCRPSRRPQCAPPPVSRATPCC